MEEYYKKEEEDYEEKLDEIYDDEAREELRDNDEISPEEEAFMKGFDEETKSRKHSNVGDKAYEQAFPEKEPDKRKPKK